ncbi:hypothetical protein AAG607_12075 [Citromicrobium bathyomarinum]|uniref:hypothetical protein n=1 Tax=Citromicrobium bathyomarinum TaxID=72174 RepID=UPI00315B0792
MLKLQSNEPVIVQLDGGATVELSPVTPAIVAAGRSATRKSVDDGTLDYDIATLAFSEGVLRAAIRSWEGIGNAGGEALECNPETIALALADPDFFGRLETAYVIPIAEREYEKNVSAASSAGTSAAATAASNTASSAADSAKTAKTPAKRRAQKKAAAKPRTRKKTAEPKAS